MVLTIAVEDNRTTIVKAPSVEELTEIHSIKLSGSAAETPTQTPEPTATPTPTPSRSPGRSAKIPLRSRTSSTRMSPISPGI
jgi:hypothetical protein